MKTTWPSPGQHRRISATRSSKKKEADFPILSDPTKQVAAAYGVLGPRGVANRWTFYIGKDGRITAVVTAVKPDTSADDMIATLKELGVPAR